MGCPASSISTGGLIPRAEWRMGRRPTIHLMEPSQGRREGRRADGAAVQEALAVDAGPCHDKDAVGTQ